MRRFLLPFASIIAALSLFSVSALAAPTTTPTDSASAVPSDADELPTACQLTAAPSATATATTVTDEDKARDDDAHDDVDIKPGRAIRACIAALHEDGEHEIGQIVSEFAHQLNAEKHAEHDAERGHNSDDDASPAVSTTPTATSTAVTSTATTTETATARDQKPAAQHGHKHGGD